MGRPSSHTEKIAFVICERLANGESLRKICKDDGMPDKTSVMRWLSSNELFRQQYAQARAEQAENMADEILDIADDSTGDVKIIDGREVMNSEFVQRSRLRVDSRKWLMSKMLPKKYGDTSKQDAEESDAVLEITGGLPDA